MAVAAPCASRVSVDGKFFRIGERKLYAKGVAYGPFAPNAAGRPFASPEQTVSDFAQIRELGANLIRIYHVPAKWFLDLAAQHQLKVLIDIPWNKHLCFLDSPAHRAQACEAVRRAVFACARHPAVFAFSVGNEILVSWSDHKLTEERAIEYVQQVKRAVTCPVTVADDFLYWQQPQAKLMDHVDFITMHAYPIWGHEDIDTAMASTIKDYESVRKAHPGKTVVIGEAGWASYTTGNKFAPRAGDEKKQKRYYEELNSWAKANNVTTFFFDAFDEPWKGSGTEGHWGLFSVDRKAKLAMQGLYPELMPAGPTSPSYDSSPAAK